MGITVVQEPPSSSHHIQDLRVTVESRSLVLPAAASKSTEAATKCMFLSNLDQALNFHVQTVHFFQASHGFPPRVVSQKLRAALEEVLVPYHFLAGRIKLNQETRRLEVDCCNAKGAGFVVAASGCTLEDLGDLAAPNPAFHQLAIDDCPPHDQLLLILQVTSFKCGGFAMGVSTNHATMDGITFRHFLHNLAAAVAVRPLPFPPCNDRRLLAARSPPLASFDHPELAGVASSTQAEVEDLELIVFRLSSVDVSKLKEKAMGASGFNAVTALAWKCKAAAASGPDPNRECTVRYAVDIRGRLEPPLPESYAGNAVLWAYASATCKELGEWGLPEVAKRVGDGARRITNAYARSVVDWGEGRRGAGFPRTPGELVVSSWWRLGLQKVGFPWGRPAYFCPVVGTGNSHVMLLLPDADDSNGVNVLVGLPTPEMRRFRACFQAFLK